MIRKEAWPFYRTTSGVRLCWELEEPIGPKTTLMITIQEVTVCLEEGRYGYLEKGIQTPMAQGRSTKIITMIKWIRTIRLSIKNSLSHSLFGRLGTPGRV